MQIVSESLLKAENERLKTELAQLKAHQSQVVAAGLRGAIEATRSSFTEGGEPWLCRVSDLEQYADEQSQAVVGVPVPAGWELEREGPGRIAVHNHLIGGYIAQDGCEQSIASIILFHLADDLLEGR